LPQPAYLNRQMQERILQLFHFALRREGYLFLGSSESTETTPTWFTPVDKKGHVYMRLAQVGTAQMSNLEMGQWQIKPPGVAIEHSNNIIPAGRLHQDVVKELAPPSVLPRTTRLPT
jgi:two-component system, chemotaxis family, CheB/CheR fusion protein